MHVMKCDRVSMRTGLAKVVKRVLNQVHRGKFAICQELKVGG